MILRLHQWDKKVYQCNLYQSNSTMTIIFTLKTKQVMITQALLFQFVQAWPCKDVLHLRLVGDKIPYREIIWNFTTRLWCYVLSLWYTLIRKLNSWMSSWFSSKRCLVLGCEGRCMLGWRQDPVQKNHSNFYYMIMMLHPPVVVYVD
jgi:hypothetical protein